ncbi:MAG: Crp/Fnr family transcriptional regulator [Elusimicrobia bacterium]|nr:Crp/Fnr family transcriptional regulator [Elusimicrobiota bacterium]
MENIKILARNTLFRGLTEKEIESILFYLNPVVRKYKKGNIILAAGAAVTDVGIILKGRAVIEKEDIRGNRSIISELGESSLFAEALACARAEHSPVTVAAETDAEVMFINFDKIMTVRAKTEIAGRLVKNMMTLIAGKNIFLNNKLEHASKRSIREKLLSYFDELAVKTGGRKFKLPFSKTALADYLFVDRSAMMRELSHMKKDGVIKYEGDVFEIRK